jgi:hypothetical protein
MAQANPVRATVSILGKIPPLPRISKWYRRTPFGRSEPKVWRRPDDEAEYQRLLHDDGFISPMYWEDDDLTKYPPIMQDLDDLEEYLLPAFLEYNQKARHYQMSYYFYQWIFIVGAFLTTVMGVLTTYFAGDRVMFLGTQYETVRLLGWETGWSMVGMFSVMTTIVSAITSYFTLLSNQGEPRKRWASYRRLAEELRMLYFKFLARLDPYDKPNRVEVLRRRVIEIREQEHSSA